MVNFSIICGKDRLSLPICTLSKDGEKKSQPLLPYFFSLCFVVGWFGPSCLWHSRLDPLFLSLPCGGVILALMLMTYLILPFSLCVCGGGDFRVQLTFSFSLCLGVGWFWPTCPWHTHVIKKKNVINDIFYAYHIYM